MNVLKTFIVGCIVFSPSASFASSMFTTEALATPVGSIRPAGTLATIKLEALRVVMVNDLALALALALAFEPMALFKADVASLIGALDTVYLQGFCHEIRQFKRLVRQHALDLGDFEAWHRYSRSVEAELCEEMTSIVVEAARRHNIDAKALLYRLPSFLYEDMQSHAHVVALIRGQVIIDLTFGQYDPASRGRFVVLSAADYPARLIEAARRFTRSVVRLDPNRGQEVFKRRELLRFRSLRTEV